jgi:hypothetical protein
MKESIRKLLRSFRLQRNRRRLAQEEKYYRNLFLKRPLSIPGENEIRAQVARRFPGRKPKSKGGLHILSIYHNYNWEGPSLGPSLAALGEVKHLDWRDPVLAGGKQPDETGWMEAMNDGVLKQAHARAADRPFDAIFTYLSGGQVSPGFLEELRSLAPVVNLALNDKETFVGRVRGGHAMGARDICRHFDLCWTSTEDALEKYVVEGALPVYLPEGANPAVHRPYDEEKMYDVSFVGQCYGNRPETVARLREAGVRVETFGPGWPNGALTMEGIVRTW